MDSLRLILLIVGVVLIAGIYLWETRWRRGRSSREFDDLDTSYLDELTDSRSRKDYGYAWDPESRRIASEGDEFVADTSGEVEDVGIDDHSEDESHQEAVLINDSSAHDMSDGEVQAREPDLAPIAVKEAELTGMELIVPGSRNKSNGKLSSTLSPSDNGLLIALTVMAPAKASFTGASINGLMEELGCTFGEMGIFHKLPETETVNPTPIYSVANALKPGTFDLGTLEEFSTPGIALFTQVTGHSGGVQAFDSMVEDGKTMAERLGGELRDETRSTLTFQAINHLREQIVEFRRQLRVKSIE